MNYFRLGQSYKVCSEFCERKLREQLKYVRKMEIRSSNGQRLAFLELLTEPKRFLTRSNSYLQRNIHRNLLQRVDILNLVYQGHKHVHTRLQCLVIPE